MLFAKPTSTPGRDRVAAPTVAFGPGSGLVAFAGGVGGMTFLAGRKRFLGTVPLSLFKSVIRSASGWLSERVAGEIFQARRIGAIGTSLSSVAIQTAVRPVFPGWLAGRRPMIFLAGRKRFLGTVPLSLFKTVVRPASGWLRGRAPVEDLGDGMSCAAAGGFDFGDGGYHLPVLPREVMEWMGAGEGKFVIDGTLGGGGHSELMLKAGARVLGVDRDPEAIAHAEQRLAGYGDRFRTWLGNFADLREVSEVRGKELADGLLLDLGVSSRQLDEPARGFSFRADGPLDMRMGPACPWDAAAVVNGWSEEELVKLFREYGEEPQAKRMAAAVVRRREKAALRTTLELADCIEKAVGRSGRIHPATRVFQAIRMVVNDELGSLERALEASVELLKPGGRLVVITFHSLEDRVVKRFMQERAKPFLDDPTWPEPRPNPNWRFRLPVRKAVMAEEDELRVNPRARSAKLRVAELLEP